MAEPTSRQRRTLSWPVQLPAGWVGPVLVVAAAVLAQLMSVVQTGASIPLAVAAMGVVNGLADALLVVGLILVYRAARIINFAHTAIGFFGLVLYLVLRIGWGWSFWLAVPAALAAGALLGVLIEVAVIRRFAQAPRLVLTVVTIALAQFLVACALLLVPLFGFEIEDGVLPASAPALPFIDHTFAWDPIVFGFPQFAAIAVSVGALGALAAFFRMSVTGVAVRGAAENRARAGLLGINVSSLSSVVWVIASLLATAGALLQGWNDQASMLSVVGSAGGAAFAGGVLVRALAAAVVAKMENLPLAIGASLAISLLDQGVFWAFRQTDVVNAVLLAVIVVALLLQRQSLSRADSDGAWEAAEELQPIPTALAGLEPVKRTVRRLGAVGVILVLGLPWVLSPSQVVEASLFAIYGIIAVSLVVLTGWGGQISLGHFGFVAVGALVGGHLSANVGLPFPLAAVGAMVVGAGVAVLVGLPALRIRGLFLAVTTLAFAVVAQSVLLNDRWFSSIIADQVSRPVFLGIDMNNDERSFYYLCLAATVASVATAVALRRTRTGRVLIALRDNERAAQSYGINLFRTRLVTFAIAGSLASLAGVLFANHQFGVSANAFGPGESIFVFLMAVMGGLGSVYGVLLGVLYFGFAQVILPSSGLQLFASSFGVLIVLLAFPGGLGGLAYRVRDSWLRRIATRYRVFVPSLLGVDRREDELDLVALASRRDEREEVPRRYVLESEVAQTGASQRFAGWQA